MPSYPKRKDELLWAACKVINDYEQHGEVLQADENGEYGRTTSIFQLQVAVNRLLENRKRKESADVR